MRKVNLFIVKCSKYLVTELINSDKPRFQTVDVDR